MKREHYTIMLDVFSGQPNPSVPITREDFGGIYAQVLMQNPIHATLFDGLGFRGIILNNNFGIEIIIQDKILQVEIANNTQRFIGNTKLVQDAFALFKKYDTTHENLSLINSLLMEYGIQ